MIGHEWAGNIVDIGSGVKHRFKEGDYVTAEGHITCGVCRACLCGGRHECRNQSGIGVHVDGAFAEYIKVPAENIWMSNDKVPKDNLACFDPFGNAVKTCLTYNLVGEDVLISGAGPIGLMALMICKKVGARKVIMTDVTEDRLEAARELGADLVLDARKEIDWQKEFPKIDMKEGIDVGLYMTGSASGFNTLVDGMRPAGKIAFLGIPGKPFEFDFSQLVFKMLEVKGI